MSLKEADTKRDQILETAGALFSTHGYDRTSIRLLADKSGVSTSTIYAHFEDKSDVFVHSLGHSIRAVEVELERALAGKADPLDTIATSVRTVHAAIAADPLLRKILTFDADLVDRRLRNHAIEAQNHFAALARNVLRRAVREKKMKTMDIEALEAVSRLAFRGWLLTFEKGADEIGEARLTEMLIALIEGLRINT